MMDSYAEQDAPAQDWASGPGTPVALTAAARRVLAVLAALADAETPVAVIAAHADISSAAALRHLQHLTRLALAEPGKADPATYRAAPGPSPLHPAELTAAGHGRAATWHLACAFEAARVLGAAALPDRELIPRDPQRPPRIPADRFTALAWFAAERDGSLVRELERAGELGHDELAWRLALLMLNIACFAGPWHGWRRVHEYGSAAARRAGHRGAQAMIEEYAGKLELTGGNPAAARARHQMSLEIRTADGDLRELVRSVNALGVTFLREGSLPEAEALFEQALGLALDSGDREFADFARMNIAAVHARTGRGGQAIEQLQSVVGSLRSAGREVYVANALEDLAAAYRAEGDLIRALETALEAEAAAVEAGVPTFLAGPLIEQARIHVERGDLRLALACLGEAHAIYEDLGDPLRAGLVAAQFDRIFLDQAANEADHPDPASRRPYRTEAAPVAKVK
ncbi:MAG TPA: hypothetical protein VH372_00215 [Actinospica sp.]|nr:hypothetical protein [Actinospica sp.]